jgi:hexosaminidase
VGYKFAVATCPPELSHNINNVPLNPSLPQVYVLVEKVLAQLNVSFADDFVHLGGDEVVTRCWSGDPSIAQWMARRNFSETDALQYFHTQLTALVPANKRPIYWQEVFDANMRVAPNAVIQVWKDSETLLQVAQAQTFGLASFGWYVVNNPMPSWSSFYLNEPCGNDFSAVDESYVLGGEACAWGEQIGDANIEEALWPVVLGAAERLWSLKGRNNVTEATPRLVEKICQLNARGVPSAPIAPGHCSQ